MSHDVTSILSEWPYEPQNTIRVVTADDGREVMQLRLPLGIEQYELEGRPDGRRPDGHESYLDFVEANAARYIEGHGSDLGFHIDHDDAVELHNEGLLYYYRYLLLFQISDYRRVIQDTEHNLRLCRVLERYAGDEEDRNAVLQFRPYILRMNAVAKAMAMLHGELAGSPAKVLEEAIDSINEMEEIESPAFQLEKVRSINYLKSTLQQVEGSPEGEGEAERLRRELDRAVQEENYERAAQLRDRLNSLG
ncbi:MAG: UvrB/UvrC motif-containing protein [Spirochaetaceae bacterium]